MAPFTGRLSVMQGTTCRDGNAEDRHGTEIERLRRQVRVQTALIAAQRAAHRETEDLFERATRAAGLGLWECDLLTERLRWSSGVYDLFGLPREAPLVREVTLAQYRPESRRSLDSIRAHAIAQGTGFTLDTEIDTRDGRRWIRLVATVERQDGIPVRLFGTKQDVTAELLLLERTRRLAERDPLTGLGNRARFEARRCEPVGTLLLIDLDGFKAVNDTHGHQAGDHCLREVARRLVLTCRRTDLLARIGGDEFAVVVEARLSPQAAADYAQRIVEALGKPVDCDGRRYRIGASVGIALTEPDRPDLYACADAALYAAKAAGRRTFRLFGSDMSSRHGACGRTGPQATG